MPKDTGIGASVKRSEDVRFTTGKGRYTDDFTCHGVHHAYFVRSPHAHAKVTGIDKSAAEAAPGVVAVYDGHQLTGDGVGNIICGWGITSKDGTPMKMGAWSALATNTVRYVGDAVAVVVAESLEQAKDAAEMVTVSYEELPVVANAVDALKAGAPQIHPEAEGNLIYDWEIGDEAATDAALASSAKIVEMEITNNRLVPNPMEPRACMAQYDQGQDHLTLHTTSQNPHVARLVLSAFYQIAPEHKLRVIAPDVGGGFGAKIYIYPEEIVCLWAARKANVPIKWTADRSESFITDAHGRDHVSTAKMGFDANNKITGFKVDTIANLGGYMSLFSSSVPTYLYATLLSGQYNIDNVHANVRAVYSNTVPVDAYRGAGRPEACYLIERMMEKSAKELGVSPADLRRANFITEFPHQTPVIMAYDIGDFNATLDAAEAAADVSGFAVRRAASEAAGKKRGLGYSCYIEACGIAPSKAVGSLGAGVGLWESAEVRVNPVGSVEVLTGSHSHGQGHETTFAQLVCERLDLPMDQIKIVHGDTDQVQFGMGTYGSRSGAVGMSAISKALDKVENKVKKIAAHVLEAAESDIVIEGGAVKVQGTDKQMLWHEVGLAAYTAHNLPDDMEPGLKEGAFYDPTNFTFPAGTYICEVEVDPETGVTNIENFVAADDFGQVINPMIVAGQVHGGIAQGVGQAMMEHAIYDADGQLQSGTYMDYTMPRADDVPSFKVSTHETFCPGNPLGIKGCGEAGAIGSPPALVNAVIDAIGTDNISMPVTPQAVWKAMNG